MGLEASLDTAAQNLVRFVTDSLDRDRGTLFAATIVDTSASRPLDARARETIPSWVLLHDTLYKADWLPPRWVEAESVHKVTELVGTCKRGVTA